MRLCLISYALIGTALAAASAFAQTNPLRGREQPGPAYGPDQPAPPRGNYGPEQPAPPRGNYGPEQPGQPGRAYGPDQPVQPEVPRFRQRPAEPPAPPKPPPAPFVLTPEQQAQVDRVLELWEKHNRDIKTFDCRFKRWIYDMVFGPVNEAKFEELGVIRYAAPDRGLFRLEKSVKNGKEVPIDNARAEHWMCDGKSIWEYCPAKRQVIEHKLPPEMQGKAIAKSPLPFLFGAEAQNLKQRYFIRLLPSQNETEICLEAWPRSQQDAANFHHAQFIIVAQGMSPFALRLVQPNGKDYTVYQFYEIVVNERWRLFQGDPFKPFTPGGWQMVPDRTPPPAEARRVPGDGRR